jgi:very-short-patch-repair endonuclease
MTLAERFLWQNLRSRRGEIKFLRQHIIGDYIVDFVSREGGIVIEVDGAYHAERQQEEKDEVRTRFLESQGFHVLRFTNEEVLYEIDEVLETINKNIKL